MTLDDIKHLDPKRIGSWPVLPKIAVLFAVLALVVGAGYWFDWQNQLEEIGNEKTKEEQLRTTFLDKKKQSTSVVPQAAR